MKKILYLAILCSLSINAFAQCHYETDKVDKFSGNKVLATKYERILKGDGRVVDCAARLNGDYKSLSFKYTSFSICSTNEGNKLLFLLSDNSQDTLICGKYSVAEPVPGSYPTIWTIYVTYTLNNNSIEKLSTSKITDIKFYTNDGYVEMELKEKNQSKIAELISCIK